MKFSTLKVDFDGPSLDFLDLRKPAHEGIKERYPRKSRYFNAVGQSFVKTVADRHEHAAYHNKSFLVVLTSMSLKTLIFQSKGFLLILQCSAAAHTASTNCDEMAGDRLTVCELELL